MELYDGASRDTLKAVFAEYGLNPNKKLGQNFLCDKNAADSIVEAAGDISDLLVVEIGPGAGALTRRLISRAKKVKALEIDAGLCRLLEAKLGGENNFTLIHGDALKEDYSALGDEPCVVVANLPYYITTPILMRILFDMPQCKRMILMMQKEVAARLTAKPSTKEYASLSVAVSYYASAERVMAVSPQCFFPVPEVDSTVVRLNRISPPVNPKDERHMFDTVRACFAMRRKTILNNLAAFDGLDKHTAHEAILRAGLDPSRRGETLTISEFCALSDSIIELR